MTTTTSTRGALEVIGSLNEAIDVEDAQLVERREGLTLIVISFLARLHIILHGLPGNAKSMTTDGILRHFPEFKLFKTQASKVSPPDQFLGPISFKAMEEDRFERIITGKFADCHVAYIDELPRAPRAVLPAFQSGMVEREFDAGNGPRAIALQSMVGTANHLPEDEELEAFFDRFTFRHVVKAPQSADSFVRILRGGIERRADAAAGKSVDTEPHITLAELTAAQDHVSTIHVADEHLERLAELYSNLLAIGIQPSVRRVNDLVGGMQAQAGLTGRDEVVEDDIMLAQHSLWTSESEIEPVYGEVVKFASAWSRETARLLDAFADSQETLAPMQAAIAQGGKPDTNDAIALVQERDTLRDLIERHAKDAGGRDTAPLDRAAGDIERTKDWIQDRILAGLQL
jgi:MoxR-like ATPase